VIEEDPEEHELAALRAVWTPSAACRVLEVGAGDGRLTRRYSRDVASVVAIDPDADAIAALRQEFPHIDARAIGVEALTLPDRSVDVVLFAWSL
jgi:16S rRNA A1518/A1519 N6-dimethyltransferase RsmA/KsgA/DIM1 with predicted DNA glycosylase/AP lyase activity